MWTFLSRPFISLTYCGRNGFIIYWDAILQVYRNFHLSQLVILMALCGNTRNKGNNLSQLVDCPEHTVKILVYCLITSFNHSNRLRVERCCSHLLNGQDVNQFYPNLEFIFLPDWDVPLVEHRTLRWHSSKASEPRASLFGMGITYKISRMCDAECTFVNIVNWWKDLSYILIKNKIFFNHSRNSLIVFHIKII